jgi:diguanylate cyclase (GGDEF)-like protein/PAS domain S-box-containing protein
VALWDAVRDPHGAVVDFVLAYANGAFERTFGWAAGARLGHRMLVLFPASASSRRFASYVRVLETGEAAESLVEYEADGRWFRLSAARAGDGVGVTVSDITARVQAERVLRRSREELETLVADRTRELGERERRFRSLTENSLDAITIVDADGTLRYGSESYERVFGYRVVDILGGSVFDLVDPADHAAVGAVFAQLLTHPEDTQSAEFRIRRGDGTQAWVQATGQNRLDDPAVQGIVVNSRDVTAQRAAAEASLRAGAMFQALAQQSLTGSYIGQDGRVIYGNPKFAEIFGYRVDELLALPRLLDLIAPEEHARVSEMLQRRIDGTGDVQYTTIVLRKDGSRVPVEVYGSTAELDGRPAVVATVLDISARVELKRALAASEAAARESEARFRVALDGMLDGFYVLRAVRDADGAVIDFTLVEANAAGEAMIGTSLDDARGLGLLELLPLAAGSGLLDRLRGAADRGERYDGEYRPHDPRFVAEWLWLQVIPMPDGVAVTARDITHRKRAEAAVRELTLRDDLTGLLNRRGFRELAEQQLKVARRHGRRDAILSLDLSGFKGINDTYGHAEGDRALAALTRVLRTTVREGDLVARLGGDEFVVYAAALEAAGEVESLAARLRATLAADNEREMTAGRPYAILTGIGAVELVPGELLDDGLARADAALYADKAVGQLSARMATAGNAA